MNSAPRKSIRDAPERPVDLQRVTGSGTGAGAPEPGPPGREGGRAGALGGRTDCPSQTTPSQPTSPYSSAQERGTRVPHAENLATPQEMLLAARPWEATTINQLKRTSSPAEAEEHLSSQ